jgi:hypothetical protein
LFDDSTADDMKAFAAISLHENAVATVGIGAAPVLVAGAWQQGPFRVCTPDVANSRILVGMDGCYLVQFMGTITDGTTLVIFDFHAEVDGVAVWPGAHVRIGGVNDSRAVCLQWIQNLNQGSNVRVTVFAQTGAGQNITVDDCGLAVMRLGPTT